MAGRYYPSTYLGTKYIHIISPHTSSVGIHTASYVVNYAHMGKPTGFGLEARNLGQEYRINESLCLCFRLPLPPRSASSPP